MDLLLVHGYFLYEDPAERQVMRPYPPLGLLYISAYLKRRGLDVEVFDTTFSGRRELDAFLESRRPPVVGIYANLMTRRNVLALVERCKALGSHVVLGGPEPASYAAEYLERGADVVVQGEGERTLEELVPHLLARGTDGVGAIAGCIVRDGDGRVVRAPAREQIPKLDELPFPDREAIDMEQYLRVWRDHHGMGSVSLITARGCPYTCRWCSHGVYGYSHRRRSPGNVADELETIVETWRPDKVWYADDVFTISFKWIREYAAELRRRGLRVPFETISREDRLNEEMVSLLAEMGCFRLWIGSESGSQDVLDAMDRRTDAKRVREMVKLLQRHGIEAGMFIMLGYERETWSDLEATVEHLKAAVPDQFLTTVAYPIKGTSYYEEVADRIVPRRAWDEGSDRDLTVAGRHSHRFYRHATRWMVSEVALHRERARERPRVPALIRSYLNSRLGRLGMHLTRRQVEA